MSQPVNRKHCGTAVSWLQGSPSAALSTAAVVAMQEVQRRGVAEAGSIAVGGHSYGAYMVGNLMAHCPDLFACGIARSGAYNR